MGRPERTSQSLETGEGMNRRKVLQLLGGALGIGALGVGIVGCSSSEGNQSDGQPPRPDIGADVDGGKIQLDLTLPPDGKFPDMGRRDGMYEPDRGGDLTMHDKGLQDTQQPKPDVAKMKPVISKFKVDFGSFVKCPATYSGKGKVNEFPLILNATNVGPNDTWTISLTHDGGSSYSPGTITKTSGTITDLSSVKYTPGDTGPVTMTITVTNSVGSVSEPNQFNCY